MAWALFLQIYEGVREPIFYCFPLKRKKSGTWIPVHFFREAKGPITQYLASVYIANTLQLEYLNLNNRITFLMGFVITTVLLLLETVIDVIFCLFSLFFSSPSMLDQQYFYQPLKKCIKYYENI